MTRQKWCIVQQSDVKNGKRVGKNGSYNPVTNTIEIDVYAGIDDVTISDDFIIPTLSHEMTHWMKAKAPAMYSRIQAHALETLKMQGITTEDRVNAEINRMKENHPDMEVTKEMAVDEIVARYCEDMLSNSKTAREFLGRMSKSEQKSFVAKVKETFTNLMDWVNKLLGQYKSKSKEAAFLREYNDRLKEVSEMWDKALEEAIQTNQNLQAEGTASVEQATEAKQMKDREYDSDLYLSESDVEEYLNSGRRRNINRRKAYDSGKKIIISNEQELRDFVSKAINLEIQGETVAYGRVSTELVDKVYAKSSGKVDIHGYFLELTAGDLYHSFKEHKVAKQDGNIPMSEDDLVDTLLRVNSAEVEKIEYHKDNRTDVKLTLVDTNDRTVVLEIISLSAGSLKFKTGWKEIDKKRNSANSVGNYSSNTNLDGLASMRDASASSNIIPQSAENTTDFEKFSDRDS